LLRLCLKKNDFLFYQKYSYQDKYPAGYPVSGKNSIPNFVLIIVYVDQNLFKTFKFGGNKDVFGPDDAAEAEQGGTIQTGCFSCPGTSGQYEETHTLSSAGNFTLSFRMLIINIKVLG
jgi:hypothetical protein